MLQIFFEKFACKGIFQRKTTLLPPAEELRLTPKMVHIIPITIGLSTGFEWGHFP
jgi:hypothetical protein